MRLLSQTACLPLTLSAATERMERGKERERRKGERKKPGKRNHDHLTRIPDPGRKACAPGLRETLGGSGHPCPPAGPPAPPRPSAAHLLQSPRAPPRQHSARHRAPRRAAGFIGRTRRRTPQGYQGAAFRGREALSSARPCASLKRGRFP